MNIFIIYDRLSQQLGKLEKMWFIQLRQGGLSGGMRIGYCVINEYPLD